MDDGLKLNRKQREMVIATLDALLHVTPYAVNPCLVAKYEEARKILAAPATTAPLYAED